MRPSKTPYAVILEGILSDEVCDHISDSLSSLETYSFRACGAQTRECESDPSLGPLESIARFTNDTYWGYDLDPGQHSWLQTYEAGNSYMRHFDGAPGQTRKLTAVLMLSDPAAYAGGDLEIFVVPTSIKIPRTRGTVVVFQPWLEHEVTPVSSGIRQTINMGFWGPEFR